MSALRPARPCKTYNQKREWLRPRKGLCSRAGSCFHLFTTVNLFSQQNTAKSESFVFWFLAPWDMVGASRLVLEMNRRISGHQQGQARRRLFRCDFAFTTKPRMLAALGKVQNMNKIRNLKKAELISLYDANFDALFSTTTNHEARTHGPFLISPNSGYWSAPIRVAFIGQETRGWVSSDRIESQISGYEGFNLGEHYRASPFWSIIRKLEHHISSK